MEKRSLPCVVSIVCILLCACADNAPMETTVAEVTTAAAPAQTTATVPVTAPVATTTAVTTAVSVAEEPGVEYAVLQNADGKETGVLFTYPDGSTYQWDCPIESPLPLFVRTSTKKHDREVAVIEYYAGDGEWRFDWLDLVDQKLLYRQTDASGYAFVFDDYLYNNSTYYLNRINREQHSFMAENGRVTVTFHAESVAPEITYELIGPNNGSGIYQNHCIPVKEVIVAETGERIENNGLYTHLYSIAGASWYLKDGDAFYEDIGYIDGEWRDYSEPRPRLTGFAALYYFEDGVPVSEGEDFFSNDNVSGYDVWSWFEHELQDKDPSISYVHWVKIDAHYAVQIVSYMYDGDYSMYDSFNATLFIEQLFYYNATASDQ